MPPSPGEEAAMPAARAISLAAALAASLALMLFPFLLRHVPGTRLHSALPVLLLGVAGLLVYGIGFIPDNRFLKILFGAMAPWVLVVGGIVLMAAG
jgi:predicted membrane protein